MRELPGGPWADAANQSSGPIPVFFHCLYQALYVDAGGPV